MKLMTTQFGGLVTAAALAISSLQGVSVALEDKTAGEKGEERGALLHDGDKIAFHIGNRYMQSGGESMAGYEKYSPETWATLRGSSKETCQLIVRREKVEKGQADKKRTFALQFIKNGIPSGFLKPEKTIFVAFEDKKAKATDPDVQMTFEDGRLKFTEFDAYLVDRGDGILRIHSKSYDKDRKLVRAPKEDAAIFELDLIEASKNSIAPKGFEEEVGEMEQVSIGATPDGKLFVVGLEKDGDLVVYDAETMDPNPWVKTISVNKKPISFEKLKKADGTEIKGVKYVATAADGTFGIIADDGKVYLFDWTKQVFEKVPDIAANASLTLEQLAIGSKSLLCATDFDAKEIYKHDSKGWVAMPKAEGLFVSVSFDGTVVALNSQGHVYTFAKGNWVKLGTMDFDRIAVANKNYIVGLSDGVMYEWSGKDWNKLGGYNLDEIAINPAKTTFVIGADGKVFHKGEAAWVAMKPAKTAKGKVAAAKPATKVTAVDKTGKPVKVAKSAKVDKTGKPVKAAKGTKVAKGAKPKVTAKIVAPVASKSRLQAKKAGKIDVKAAQKTVKAKKDAAKKTQTAKPGAKKVAAKKVATKLPKKLAKAKTPAKKTAPKKTAAKKAVKKAAPKKTSAKKTPAKKTAAKKATVKVPTKTPAKKTPVKTTPASAAVAA